MSQAQATPDDQPVTEKHEKDVVITAYSGGEFEDKREFIDAIFGDENDVDVHKTNVKENHEVELQLSVTGNSRFGEKEFTEKIRPYSSSDKEALADALDEEDLPEWLEFTNTKTVVEEHENMLSDAITPFVRQEVDEDALDDLGYDHGSFAYTRSWTKEVEDVSVDANDGDTINHDVRFNVRSSGVDQRRVLVHQSDRTKKNQYEGEDEQWSFEIKAHLESGTNEELNEVSERLVPEMYESLFGLDGINSVRLTSCEQNVSRVGECYNF